MEKFKLREKGFSAPQAVPIYKLLMASMVWNISIGELGFGAWLCPLPPLVQLLVIPTWETAKRP